MTAAAPAASATSVLNWGILGPGAIAKAFAKGVAAGGGKAAAQGGGGRVVAAASRDAARAKAFAEQFGIPTAYGDYDALLADPQVQAVYIATPHPLHAQWALRAIAAGKHVLVEKPFALNQWGVMSVLEAARARGVFAMEAFMYRCHPQTAKLVELIRGGAIGEVRVIQATFSFHAGFNPASRLFDPNLGGGGILDVGCYPMSFARLVAGAALGRPFANPLDLQAHGHLGQSGVDEWAVASCKFENDIVATLGTGVGVNQENVARIFGSDGHIFVPNPWTADREKGGSFTLHVARKGKPVEQVTIETDRTAFAFEAQAAAAAIARGDAEPAAPAMTWDDTLGNLAGLDRWREAIGLTYPMELPAASAPVTGRPLQRPADAPIPTASLEYLDKPMSRIILGCDNQRNFAHAAAMFDDWFLRGGTAFDTAWVYGGGHQERMLGAWINARGVRKDVVVTTKGAHTPRCLPHLIVEDLHTSLDRMQQDHTDIYIMHRDNPDLPVGELVDVLNEQVDKGLIRGPLGGSNWSIERFKAANEYAKKNGKRPLTILNNNLSLAHMVKPVWNGCVHVSDAQSRQWLEQSQTTVFSWSSQARGYFLPEADRLKLGQGNFECWDRADNQQRRERATELAARHGVSPLNIVLAYVLGQPFPVFALVGPRTIRETVTTLPGLTVKLSPREVAYLALDADTL